jgi:hypothetical protein
MVLDLPGPDQSIVCTDPDPDPDLDPFIIKQK